MKVFVTYKIPQAGLTKLESKFDLSVNPEDRYLTKLELLTAVSEADALVSMLNDNINREVLDAGKHLRVIANYAVGYNNIDIQYATSKGIMVTNTPDVLTNATADLAWSLLMASARRIVEADSFMRCGKFKGWKPQLLLGEDVFGAVLGIIGFGRIGRAVAARAAGFNMKIIYYDEKKADPEIERTYKAEMVNLDTLLKESDFITLHASLTHSTHHLIDQSRFALMKPTAHLINTSRGQLIDEQALVSALQEKRIAGAALDVYEKEPELCSGLSELENVVLVPHIGSATRKSRDGMAGMAADNVIAVLSGENPPNLVNTELFKKIEKIQPAI